MQNQAASMMLVEDFSVLDFDATVQSIQDEALAAGWKVPSVHTISKSVTGAGYDVLPMTVIELCSASIAGRALSNDEGRHAAPMMPCRVGVYKTSDGKIVISRMNSPLIKNRKESEPTPSGMGSLFFDI